MTNTLIPLLPTTNAAARRILLETMTDATNAIILFTTREKKMPESSIYYGDDADYIPAAAEILASIASLYFENDPLDTLYTILFDDELRPTLETADFSSPLFDLIAFDC